MKTKIKLKYNFFRLTVLVFLLTSLSLITLQSCSEKKMPTEPPPNPPGYQEDIPWSSLADSPWPMNHHDPQSTGRSKFVGPSQGIIAGKIQSGELQNSIVLGTDKNLFFSPTRDSASLYSVDYTGNVIWKIALPSSEIFTTPLIAADGTIYFYSRKFNEWNLYAVSKEGTILWSYKPGGDFQQLGMNIGLDGTLYFIDGFHNLVALSKSGDELWKYNDARFWSSLWSSLTFAPDGKTIYIQGFNDVSLLAFDIINKEIKWIWGSSALYNSPIVDSDGNIYLFPSHQNSSANPKFYSLKPDGSLKWEFEYTPLHYDKYLNLDPTIDKKGNVYFGLDTIYSLDYNGVLRWKYGLGTGLTGNNYSPLVCDAQSNVYIGLVDNRIISLNSEGYLRWEVFVDGERTLGLSPAISEDGTLFYPTWRSDSIIIIK